MRAIPSARTRTRAWTTPRKAAVAPLQPYSSKEEAQSAGPDSWAGHAANSGITALLSKSNAVNPSAWTTCRALAAPRPRRSECHPRRIAGVAARQGLLLHADSHYVDPVSSRQRVPAPTGLAEHAYTNMHIQQWDLRVIPAACCAPAAFKRSAMHQARLERVELRQADRLAARAELGQLQDHYHQNDNDQDADNDPNDSTVHFSSFRFACGSDLGNNITLSAHPVLANIFLRVRIRSIHNSTTPRADALHP